MRLTIHRTVHPGKPGQFEARCVLELSSSDRTKFRQFGAPPLTERPIEPAPLGYPPHEALLSMKELNDLVTLDGLVYHSNDVRTLALFVERLVQICKTIPAYWKQAGAWAEASDYEID